MSKWFEVTVATWEVIVVEVADDEGEDEAAEAAFDECSFSFSENKEVEKIEALNTPEEIDCAKRHATEVSELPHNAAMCGGRNDQQNSDGA